MNFSRKQSIERELALKRALVIYGPRRVGKTTLLQKYLDGQKDKKMFFATGDDLRVRELFLSEDRKRILDFAAPYDIVAIDEAQSVRKIGLGAKMIIDAHPEKTLILTGSSSFDLSSEIGEPLTGRHFTMTLLPLSQGEMDGSRFELQGALSDFLIHGSYPEVLLMSDAARKERILNELVSSYLFKDILAFERVRSADIALGIVKCLAFQIGNEVSVNEIARTVKADVKTVSRYLDVLEKMFVIQKVRGFSRNLRSEISKKSKYYFYDTGVRNAVISQWNGIDLRDDTGRLFENFVFMELYKKSMIAGRNDSFHFWRTHAGAEIDIVIESGGALRAIECKWSKAEAKVPSAWKENYPDASFEVVTKENYLDVVLD